MQPQPKPVPKSLNTIEKQPIGMATAYFKLTDTNDKFLSEMPDCECTAKFIEYMRKFKRTSDPGQCQEISMYLSKVKKEYKGVSEKDLLQIWNLGLRSTEEIELMLPGVAKNLPEMTIQGILNLLETKSK